MSKIILFISLLGLVRAFAQESYKPLIVVLDTIPYPEMSGEPLIIEASPQISTNRNSYQMKAKHWMHYDYINSTEERDYIMTANIYTYILRGNPRRAYQFFYGDQGEVVSHEKYKSMHITSTDLAIPSILRSTYKWRLKADYSRELWEVSRWQHPNLYIVAYDKQRKSYYMHRVAMVVYCDESHPKAYYMH